MIHNKEQIKVKVVKEGEFWVLPLNDFDTLLEHYLSENENVFHNFPKNVPPFIWEGSKMFERVKGCSEQHSDIPTIELSSKSKICEDTRMFLKEHNLNEGVLFQYL